MIRGGCPLSGQGLCRNVEGGLTHPSAPGQKIPRSDMKDEVLEQKMLRTIKTVYCAFIKILGQIFVGIKVLQFTLSCKTKSSLLMQEARESWKILENGP